MSAPVFLRLLTAVVLCALVAGCGLLGDGSADEAERLPALPADGLSQVADRAEVVELLTRAIDRGEDPRSVDDDDEVALPAPPGADDGGGGDSGGSADDFTNLQESGVDEADQSKTDGSYWYDYDEGLVRVWDLARPATPIAELQLDLGSGYGGLFLVEDRLVVVDSADDAPIEIASSDDRLSADWVTETSPPPPDGMPWYDYRPRTGIVWIDVADPATPTILSEERIDGRFHSARRIGDDLIVVLQHAGRQWGDGSEPTDDQVVPRRWSRAGDDSDFAEPDFAVDPSACWHSPADRSRTLTMVGRWSVSEAGAEPAIGSYFGHVETVYATTDRVYLAATTWRAYDELDERHSLRSRIVAFDPLADVPTPVAQGSVWGSILNRYSLGVHDGVLAVATNTWGWWGVDRATHLFTLREVDGALVEAGRVERLAPGERLYAARFRGATAYLVTFVQIDPLFVIDLSDPQAPAVRGELKLPGFSDYLHPVADGRLVGIGQYVDPDSPWATRAGVQVNLFDVSDPTAPSVLASWVDEGDSVQNLGRQPHAFFLRAADGQMVFPVSTYDDRMAGIDILRFSTDELTLLERHPVSTDEPWSALDRCRPKLIGDRLVVGTDGDLQVVELPD